MLGEEIPVRGVALLKGFVLKCNKRRDRRKSIMIELTRLYKQKKSNTVKKHSITIAKASIESIRGSTVLKNQKATVRTVSGMEIPVTETKKDIIKKLGARPR
jgi:hypothetical protein